MAEMKARIVLEDNVSTEIMRPIDAIDKLKNSATSASQAINSISNKKVNVDASGAIDKIKNVKEDAENITKRKYEVALNAIDKTKEVSNKVKSGLSSLSKTSATVAIKAKDETLATMNKVKEGIMSLKALAAGIVIGFAGKSTIGAASKLEQEQIAMKHFIGYNNQGSSAADVQKMTDNYISQLRTEANATPFSTNEVIAAGRRAVNITGGDTSKAMDSVKLAENMAALNPGKSVMDAMEALADLKTGEFERMKEFGFKFSADQFKGLVGKGKNDNLTDSENSTAYDMLVKNKLNPVFKGGADELSKSTAGQWSTVTGNLESIGANFGKAFLPVINKVLTPLAGWLDKNSDKFTNFGESIVKVGGKIGTALTPAFETISKTVGPVITSIVDTVSKNLPVIVKYFKDVWTNIKPYLQEFGQTIKENVIPVVMDIWSKVQDAMPAIKDLFKAAFEVAVDAIKIAIKVFDWVAPKIQTMWDTISPVLNLVIDIFNNVASAIKTAVDWLSNWNGTKAEDKTPSFNTTPGEYDFIKGKKNPEQHGYNFITGKAYASGTDFAEGGLSLVGELGPELVNLPKGAQVINNKNTMNMLKGSNMAAQFAKTGEDIPTNLAKGIKKTSPSLMDAMSTTTQDLIQNFGTGITDNSKYPIKSTNELTKNVSGIFTTLGQQSNPLGQSVSQGLGQGIQDSSANVTDIAKTLTDKVIETFKTGFDIHSPSRVMHEIGSHVMQGFVNGLSSKDLKSFADKQIGTITSAFGAMVNVPGGVSEWLTQALVATGTPLSWLPGLKRLVMAESGGDPNNWNPQSVGGEHATGLLQTLPSTFQEFMQKGMNNIQNPVDNAAAAINYIKSRYGDVYNTPLFKGGSYVGYANGTSYATPGYHWVGKFCRFIKKFINENRTKSVKSKLILWIKKRKYGIIIMWDRLGVINLIDKELQTLLPV